MLVKGFNWNECDFCFEQKPSTISAVARGATGRYCPVMSVCDDCAPSVGDGPVLTTSEAYELIEQRGDGYADF